MNITVVNLQKRIPLKPQPIVKIVRTILKHEKIRDAHLSIVLVTDARIRSLHKKYLKEDRPTDVLSFDFLPFRKLYNFLKDGKSFKLSPKAIFSHSGKAAFSSSTKPARHISGEIVISTDTAVQNARVFESQPYQEIILYITHGILHLLGYDDHTPSDIQVMRQKEKELMNLIER